MEQDTNNTVATLYAAFQGGDMNAFSKLYDLHVNILFHYGCRLTTDKELLRDCIHDIFVKLYTKRGEFDIENLKSYLIISLKNRLCDELRKRMHLSDTSVEEFDTASTCDIEGTYLAEEKREIENRLVDRLLNQLSPRQRQALTLYYIEEKKYEDICQIMDMNYQSVRNLMHRGITKLRSISN
ncbi:RNA polymerase sigma factor [Bacteroides sp.]|uniref:RNA polymerase sigma factor n=1 Tax=Bacteroides sp. TaxID=29523 RepID=UPI001B6770F8|nr:RNA polymerase sigma factor [Bacteroides sp.]MBP6936959.1 RNA polymerase sigma factor [Bacteroides sp.]